MEIEQKLKEYLALEKDWDSYGSDPPNEVAASNVRRVISEVSNHTLPKYHTVVSAEGGITVAFEVGKKYADIECFNDGDVYALTGGLYEMPESWKIENDSALRDAVKKIREFFA